MIGVIHIDGERRNIYKDGKGFHYVKEEYVDIGISLKSHVKDMQDTLNDHPDAELDWSSGYGDSTVVVRYKVYVSESDEKILKEIRKRSPELFKK